MVNVSEKSQFNDAIGSLKRLDLYFRLANYFNSVDDVNNWYKQLNILFSSLRNFVPKERYDDMLKELVLLRDEVNVYVIKKNNNPVLNRIPKDLYWRLYNFQLFLQEVYGISGLETKTMDDAMRALR